jgi:hypothetical protein
MRTRESDLIAKKLDKQRAGLDLSFVWLAIDSEFD